MSKGVQFKDKNNVPIYPNPYYPVGSIYLSVNDINPSKWFGGKWEQIAKGRTLVGVDKSQPEFNEVKKTGGEKTHILSVEEMPSHTHEWFAAIDGGSDAGAKDRLALNGWGESRWWSNVYRMNSSGGNRPHNNVQPYFTCYIWCRIA